MQKVTPFLMFDDQLEQAIESSIETFPDSRVESMARAGGDGPMTAAEFVVGGQRFKGFNGGSYFSFSEGVSFFFDCADQTEVDRIWEAILAAGGRSRSADGSAIRSGSRGRSSRVASSS